MEVSELPALQVVTHVRRLLLVSQGVLPNVDSSAPAHSQHAPLADVTPGGRAGGEVGVQRLVGAQIPHFDLSVCACSHHPVACGVCCH